MKYIVTVFLLFLFLFSSEIYALTTSSYDTQKKKTHTKERSLQQRQSIDFRETSSSRQSSTKKSSTTVEVALDSLIFAEIAKLETQREPYRSCSLITNPPLPADFDLTAEVRPDVIDLYKAEYLSKAAQSNLYMADIVDVSKLKQYVQCIYQYANTVAYVLQKIQSSYNTISDVQKHISSLVRQYQPQLNINININFSKCRFSNAINRIQCEELEVEIDHRPKMFFKNQKIFADSTYMNISSRFSIEKSAATEFALANEKASQTISEIALSQRESFEKSKNSGASAKTPALPQ